MIKDTLRGEAYRKSTIHTSRRTMTIMCSNNYDYVPIEAKQSFWFADV